MRGGGLLVLITAGVALGALGSWLFAAGVRAAILGWHSRRWPAVRGRIVESAVAESSQGARLAVHYAYEIDGIAHTGATLGFASPGSRWNAMRRRDDVRALAQRYPAGRQIDVFYWSVRPSVSVLEPGFHRTSLGLMAIGGAWLGIGAAVCSLALLRYA